MPHELGLGPGLLVGPLCGIVLYLLLAGGSLPGTLPTRLGRTLATRWASLAVSAGLEEALWRGLVLGGLAVTAGLVVAVTVSTIGFAAWHWRTQGRRCGVHLVTGAGFATAFLLGGLPAAFLAHCVYNFAVDWAVQVERARLRGP